MKKVVFFIDGYYMWKRISYLKIFYYDGKNIRNYCLKHLDKEDDLYRIFYYDTGPLNAKGHNPISGNLIDFKSSSASQARIKLFESLKSTPNFALRLGRPIWANREWLLKPEKFEELLKKEITIDDLQDEDVEPHFEQKMVDIKIGLDIAWIAMKKLADFLIIITGDTDFVPVLKFARKEGMQVCLDPLGAYIRPELSEHVDYIRNQTSKYKKKESK
ncbi:MAG: NYN domain-containing protein [Deltaproteobacteria bacterium]|nr:NYN domain-containing protein [Deltaproteobacteria bacterium]